MIHLLLALGITFHPAAPRVTQAATVSGTVVDQASAGVPGAAVTLVGADGSALTISGRNGEYSFQNVRRGTYRITVTLIGFATGTRNDVQVDSVSVRLPTIMLRLAGPSETVVVSATKSETAVIDAPAAVSVIDGAVLASTTAQNFSDLLRTVPGVNVIQLSARDVNVTTREAPSTLANSLLVLVDDRPVVEDFFGLVLWDFLPTNLADVKQIEAIRGPASAVWGGDALTGVVNIITKSPREAPGTTVSLTAGTFSRNAGSTIGKGVGTVFDANASVARAPNATWAYRVSAGYFNEAPSARPTGEIPLIPDPNDPSVTVGGGFYPVDGPGPIGTAYRNSGTSQPKFDARIDQEIADGRITYAAGIAGSSGVIYTGIGPFDIQPGSYVGYAKVNYRKRGLKIDGFANFASADAPNLLLADPATQGPLQLSFSTQTYDIEIGDAVRLGSRQVLTLGGNVRRNNFDVSIAPSATNLTSVGGYVQDEVVLGRLRLTLGGRADKAGNESAPVFSPRVAAVLKLTPDQSLRVSFNRAFRSPPPLYNYLSVPVVSPTDLSSIAPLLPPDLRPLVADPFPLVVHIAGSSVPIGNAPRPELIEESLTAYEVAYTREFSRRTTVSAVAYLNDIDHDISQADVPSTTDPYTEANPPPGWQLPPSVLTTLAQNGIFLPKTAFTYVNGGPRREKGLELSADHQFARGVTAFANYSWQAKPVALGGQTSSSVTEATLPSMNRFNAGFNFDGRRMVGSASMNYVSRAFWSDVLLPPDFGFTNAYTLLNGSVGFKWAQGKVTALVKGINLTNQDIMQHVFGDILKRSVTVELRLAY